MPKPVKAPSSPPKARRLEAVSTQRPGRRRAVRKRLAASAVPLPCLVLAVDTATRSGWACVAGPEEYLGFGEADTLDAASLDYVVRWAASHAAVRGLPLVLVLEAPFGGPMPMVVALGGARERWLCAWRGREMPRHHVVSVQPSEWRARILGQGWARATRERVRHHEQGVAAAIVGESVGPDEAAAILIARWGLRAAKVALALQPSAARRRR